MPDNFYRKHWDRVRSEQRQQREAGSVVVRSYQGRIHITAPYRETFRRFLRTVESARWRVRSGVWSIAAADWDRVRSEVERIYGHGAICDNRGRS